MKLTEGLKNMAKKAALHNLGCKVNAYETESMQQMLEAAGYEAWCVGGCVRDFLLGCEPGDWDVTTNALPEETTALFGADAPT